MTKWGEQSKEVGFYEFHEWSRPVKNKKSKNWERKVIINILLGGYLSHAIVYLSVFPNIRLATLTAWLVIAMTAYLGIKNNRN